MSEQSKPGIEVTSPRDRFKDVDTVALVRGLGSDAVDMFLTDLSPHFTALTQGTEGAADRLRDYLFDAGVSATILQQAGGIEAYREASLAAVAASGPVISVDEAIAKLEALFAQHG